MARIAAKVQEQKIKTIELMSHTIMDSIYHLMDFEILDLDFLQWWVFNEYFKSPRIHDNLLDGGFTWKELWNAALEKAIDSMTLTVDSEDTGKPFRGSTVTIVCNTKEYWVHNPSMRPAIHQAEVRRFMERSKQVWVLRRNVDKEVQKYLDGKNVHTLSRQEFFDEIIVKWARNCDPNATFDPPIEEVKKVVVNPPPEEKKKLASVPPEGKEKITKRKVPKAGVDSEQEKIHDQFLELVRYRLRHFLSGDEFFFDLTSLEFEERAKWTAKESWNSFDELWNKILAGLEKDHSTFPFKGRKYLTKFAVENEPFSFEDTKEWFNQANFMFKLGRDVQSELDRIVNANPPDYEFRYGVIQTLISDWLGEAE